MINGNPGVQDELAGQTHAIVQRLATLVGNGADTPQRATLKLEVINAVLAHCRPIPAVRQLAEQLVSQAQGMHCFPQPPWQCSSLRLRTRHPPAAVLPAKDGYLVSTLAFAKQKLSKRALERAELDAES